MRMRFFSLAATATLFTFLFQHASGQNMFPSTGSVGIGTTSPNTSSLLEVNSTTKGVLIPRMTAAQRAAISTPAQALLVFQTDGTTGFYYYNSGWKVVTPATSGFANTKLSNLATPTSINQTLLPSTTNARDLGSSTLAFRNLYLRGDVYLDGTRFVSNAPGTGQHNAFLGSNTGVSLTSGTDNTALGHYALNKTTTGAANTVSGAYALFTNTTGYSNTAVGTRALYFNTSGFKNTAVGDSALYNNTTGYENLAAGYQALYNNTTARDNIAIGYQTLFTNTSGLANEALGNFALHGNSTGNVNVAFGYNALASNSTGTNNVGYGNASLYNNSIGSYNSALGIFALQSITTNNFNTGVGYQADAINTLQGTFLGALATASPGLVNVTAVGYGASATFSNQVMLGNAAVTSVWAAGPHVIYSDGRFKQDLQADVPGLEFINQLKPVTYHYNIHALDARLKAAVGTQRSRDSRSGVSMQAPAIDPKDDEAMRAKEQKLYTGFIAQDVEKAAKSLNYDFSGVYKPQNDKDVYGLSYADFVVPLVKAVQQLDSLNKRKEERITKLETEVVSLKEIVSKLVNGASIPGNILTSTYLEQNTPNPANAITHISYTLPSGIGAAQLLITDAAGKSIKIIPLLGSGSVDVNTTALSGGIYNYTLVLDGQAIATKKMLVTR